MTDKNTYTVRNCVSNCIMLLHNIPDIGNIVNEKIRTSTSGQRHMLMQLDAILNSINAVPHYSVNDTQFIEQLVRLPDLTEILDDINSTSSTKPFEHLFQWFLSFCSIPFDTFPYEHVNIPTQCHDTILVKINGETPDDFVVPIIDRYTCISVNCTFIKGKTRECVTFICLEDTWLKHSNDYRTTNVSGYDANVTLVLYRKTL